jgi:hypothetical protein
MHQYLSIMDISPCSIIRWLSSTMVNPAVNNVAQVARSLVGCFRVSRCADALQCAGPSFISSKSS